MANLENFYGIASNKKTKLATKEKRTVTAAAKANADQMVIDASVLYTKEQHMQALSLLEGSIKIYPHNPKAYHLAGLIHEDCGNTAKSLNGYFLAAMLSKEKKSDKSTKFLWNKVLEMADFCSDQKKLISAINKINKKTPSLELHQKKLNILKQDAKDYFRAICCEIDIMKYTGVSFDIFKKLDEYTHKVNLTKVSKHLVKLIKKSQDAQCEEFLVQSLKVIYRACAFERYLFIYDNFYAVTVHNLNNNLKIMHIISQLQIYYNSNSEKYLGEQQFISYHKKLLDLSFSEFDESLICDLIQFYYQSDKLLLGIELCEKINEQVDCIKIKVLFGEMTLENNEFEKAASIFTQLLHNDVANVEYKTKLYEIYTKQGNIDMANQFKISNEIVKDEIVQKSDLRYTNEECKKMRQMYQSLFIKEATEDEIDYLLNEFFTNKFVTNSTGKFATFFERHKKYTDYEKVGEGLIAIENFQSKRDEIALHIEMASLHGLTVQEWRQVLFYGMSFYLKKLENSFSEEYFDKIKLFLDKASDARFWDSGLCEFDLFWIKLSLVYEDKGMFLEAIKRITTKTNYSALNLCMFLSEFMEGFAQSSSFVKYLKTIQRFYFLRFEAKTEKKSAAIEEIEMPIGDQKCLEFNTVAKTELSFEEKESLYTHDIFLNSFFPRFIYNSTINKIMETVKITSFETKMQVALIYLNNSHSRTISNKHVYLNNGFNIMYDAVVEADMDECLKNYILGKLHHFVGNSVKAEEFYFKCINSDTNPTVRKMAVHNLSILCAKNKSKTFRKILARK